MYCNFSCQVLEILYIAREVLARIRRFVYIIIVLPPCVSWFPLQRSKSDVNSALIGQAVLQKQVVCGYLVVVAWLPNCSSKRRFCYLFIIVVYPSFKIFIIHHSVYHSSFVLLYTTTSWFFPKGLNFDFLDSVSFAMFIFHIFTA